MNAEVSEDQNQLPPCKSRSFASRSGGNWGQPGLQTGNRRLRGDGRDGGTAMHEQKGDKNGGEPAFPNGGNEPVKAIQTDARLKIRRAVDSTGASEWKPLTGTPLSVGNETSTRILPESYLPTNALFFGNPNPTRILPFAYWPLLQRCVGPWERVRISQVVWSSLAETQQEASR